MYGAFAQFLRWRSDLLPADYLNALRGIKIGFPAIPRPEFARVLSRELGAAGEQLVRDLDQEPCWSTFSRCAYTSKYRGQTVVVQLARDPVGDAEFANFENQILRMRDPALRGPAASVSLQQFRRWLSLGDSSTRERSFLEALSGLRGRTLAEYPLLIPELSTPRILCSTWIEGEPVSRLMASGSAQALEKVAESILEQLCVLSVVNAELDPDAMVITPGGRLAFRRATRLLSVPPALARTAVKYVSAVLSGNSTTFAHLLTRMTSTDDSAEAELRLRDTLSCVQPELKINLRFPPSVLIFESNWRALSRSGVEAPLFLDCLHGNMIAVGYWNAEAQGGAIADDILMDAQWAVLGNLLRFRLGELLSREKASEWVIGSGLLFFEGLRQLNRTMDEYRDNDLRAPPETAHGSEADSDRANRAVKSAVLTVMLLVTFLVCLRFAPDAAAPFSQALAGMAVAAAAGLFWTVSRSP